MTNWTFDNIPDQTGGTAIVTGANTGIGLETARMLALRGANVVLACRSPEKGAAALARIRAENPKGETSLAALDLSDLDSVAAFSTTFSSQHERLDILANNGGVMIPPQGRAKQGFELQIGTNHFGHFALAGRLLLLLLRAPNSRMVVVSSTTQNFGRIDFHELNWERRRYSASSEDEAPPTRRAATDPEAESGRLWGPSRFSELNGPPVPARIPKRAQDATAAARLW